TPQTGSSGQPGEPEVLVGGEARRYSPAAGHPVTGQPAALEPDKFVRRLPGSAQADPNTGLLAYEGFDYDDPEALAKGKGNGGSGWAGPWRGSRFSFKPPGPAGRPAAINPREGLGHLAAAGAGGCFDFTGFVKYTRRLASPVRLDEDGVYYL